MSGTVASVLEFNAVRFGQGPGALYGFLPGELYQEVYGRDLFTASKAAQYLYGDAFLRSGVERFLELQHATLSPRAEFSRAPYPSPGALHGLLKRDGSGEKTTAVSDEEASVVQLAHLYYQLRGGTAWLRCDIAGKPVIERLNRAAEVLLQGRGHPATGLLKRSHTTDWGDVRMQGGLAVTDAPPVGETWTASIYDQAWMYQALVALAAMNDAAGLAQPADHFREQAARLKDATNRLLWMPDRGYYRIHLHLTTLEHDFDEDAMVAIGNAVAVYAGLTDEAQTRTIVAALERARLRAGSLKPGLSVDPPYHEGFFRHHLQYESGRYQNGGQWDWWGGVQVTAEFEAGYSALAWQHLTAIAQDWATHPNDVAEWQVPRTNRMEGSHQYAGAAGTVAEAVVRGAFGVELTANRFTLRPRLGERNAYLNLTQPAANRSLWYRQRVIGDALVMQYRVTGADQGTLAVLLPEGKTATGVVVDGTSRAFALTATGRDRYVTLDTLPGGAHTVQITFGARPGAALAAEWLTHTVSAIVPAESRQNVTLRVANASNAVWARTGDGVVQAHYRWIGQDGQTVDSGSAALPRAVDPSQIVDIQLALPTPAEPGQYRLQVDLGAAERADTNVREPGTLDLPVTVAAPSARGSVDAWPIAGLAKAGQVADLGFTLRNTSPTTWQRPRLVSRWLTTDGRPYSEPGLESAEHTLHSVRPGQSMYAPVALRAPQRLGAYRLSLELTDGGRPLSVAIPESFDVSVVP